MGILEALIQSRKKQPIDHWPLLVDNYQMPPQEFYGLLEAALRTRQAPEVEMSHVEYKESNLLSDRRTYLRLTRGPLLFDCCAAPFGSGYLFSCWLWWLPRPFTLFHGLGMVTTLGILPSLAVSRLGRIDGPIVLSLGLLALFIVLRTGLVRLRRSVEEYLHGLTLFGVVYELFFRRPTYFEEDTAYAFYESVHRGLIEVLDGLAQTHSLRALTEEERQPIMRDFFRKRIGHGRLS